MLNMPGPQFLLLYLMLSLLAYALVAYSISRRELDSGGPDPRQLRDPYAMAYLRGGSAALLRVVVLSLLLREKLHLQGNKLMADGTADLDAAAPIEAAVLRASAAFITVSELARASQVRACIEDYHQELIRAQLIASPGNFRARLPVCLAAMACLIVLTGAKVHVALASGHRNINFLLILTAVACLSLLIPLAQRRTGLGRRTLGQLRALFASLPRASSVPAEATLLAAVFGVYSLAGYHRLAWNQVWGLTNSQSVDSGSSLDSGSSHSGSSCSSAGGGHSSSCGSGGGSSGCGGCGGSSCGGGH